MDTTTSTTPHGDVRETLSGILRGELAAVETYEHALRKIDGAGEGISRLQKIHREHVEAVEAVRSRLLRYTQDVPTGSGAWGAFAITVEGVASLLGNKPALKALQEGEEHGARLYERALAQGSDVLDPETRALLMQDLLPRCRAHVAVLEQMIASIK